jgi:hypothetical protein
MKKLAYKLKSVRNFILLDEKYLNSNNLLQRVVFVRSVFYRILAHRRYQINTKWKNLDYVISNISTIENLPNFLNKNKNIPEIEHQVGRYINMCKIANEITANDIDQVIVEFGTYQGLGLLLLDLAFAKNRNNANNNSSCKLVGIDSFNGLPESSSIWSAGQFSDTSIEICRNTLLKYMDPKSSFELISGDFKDSNLVNKLIHYSNAVVFHFDADLGSSTAQALFITQHLLEGARSVYFLFDDWGCHPNEVPDAFYNWFIENSAKLNMHATKISFTKYSRYYRIDFN